MTPGRILLPAMFFAVWFIAAGVMHLRLAGPMRTHYLEAGKKISMIQQDFAPPRARILALDNTPLAWSERYFDLVWCEQTAPSGELRRRLAKLISMDVEPEIAPDRESWILRRDLLPDELLKTPEILRLHPALAVRSRLERIVVNIPEIRQSVGQTELRDGVLYGVSGWEKQYDAQLRGTSGRFEVMLDRHRRWIDSTWKLLTPAVPGKDIQVPCQLGGR